MAAPFGACRFGIGIFYVLLVMLLKVAFDGATWLEQLGRLVGLLYLFLIIVQVGGRGAGRCEQWSKCAVSMNSAWPARFYAGSRAPHWCGPLLWLQLIINMKNKPEAVEKVHSFCAIYFCLYMLVFTGVTIRCSSSP